MKNISWTATVLYVLALACVALSPMQEDDPTGFALWMGLASVYMAAHVVVSVRRARKKWKEIEEEIRRRDNL